MVRVLRCCGERGVWENEHGARSVLSFSVRSKLLEASLAIASSIRSILGVEVMELSQ